MNKQRKKRALGARGRRLGQVAALLTGLVLAWMALAPSNTGERSAPCGVEANLSIERMGP
jgi:hypothetical protein